MALKPQGKLWQIREQIIEDPVSGLMVKFEMGEDGMARLSIYGDLPYGNRQFIFDHTGREAGAGTARDSVCRPSWLREVKN